MDLDRFLNFFNWISSIDGVRGDVFSLFRNRGGGVGIPFAAPDDVAGQGVEDALKRYKIPVWGRRVTGHMDVPNGERWMTFSLRTEAHRADWARYIIWRLGCHVVDDPNPNNAKWASQHAELPPAWADGPRQDLGEQGARDRRGERPKQTAKPVETPARRLFRELW